MVALVTASSLSAAVILGTVLSIGSYPWVRAETKDWGRLGEGVVIGAIATVAVYVVQHDSDRRAQRLENHRTALQATSDAAQRAHDQRESRKLTLAVQHNLSYSDFRRQNLAGFSFGDKDLRHAQFAAADLRNTALTHADLRYADLGGARLQGADLSTADLRRSLLAASVLDGAALIRAKPTRRPGGARSSSRPWPRLLSRRQPDTSGPCRHQFISHAVPLCLSHGCRCEGSGVP